MNLLIVDDEISAIKAVQKGIHWDRLNFINVYTALSKQEAIDVILNKNVDIMLSDIEMPMGSGLELMEWVNQNAPCMRCIFMTCHADFSFAQKAMQLGSLDYILKPLDFEKMEQAILKAIKLVWEDKNLRQISKSWIYNKENLLKSFWMDIFLGEIASNESSVKQYINQKNLDIPLENTFLPILISVKQYPASIEKEDYKLLQYALRNIVQEVFILPETVLDVIPFLDNTLLIMLSRSAKQDFEVSDKITQNLNSIIEVSQRYLKLLVCCYIGELVSIYEIPKQLEILQTMDYNNVVFSQNILYYNKYKDYSLEYKNNVFVLWELLLEQNNFDDIAKEIHNFFHNNDYINKINREFLNNFSRDFYFLLIGFARKHKVSLDVFFSDEESANFSKRGLNSLEGLLQWVDFALKKLRDFDSVGDPVEKTKRYINEHISEELTMGDLAKNVHLNADYLTRIFKKQMGLSINRYIIERKINVAKWLLENTSETIGDVAARVGYYNYSSFNRIFSKVMGISPSEYKNSLK